MEYQLFLKHLKRSFYCLYYENVFYLPEESRRSYIKQNAKQNDTALEKNNSSLKGALPDNYFSRLGLNVSKLSSLIDTIYYSK